MFRSAALFALLACATATACGLPEAPVHPDAEAAATPAPDADPAAQVAAADPYQGWPAQGNITCDLDMTWKDDATGASYGLRAVYAVDSTGVLGNAQNPLLRTAALTMTDPLTGSDYAASHTYDVYRAELDGGQAARNAETGALVVVESDAPADAATGQKRTWLFAFNAAAMTLTATASGPGLPVTLTTGFCHMDAQ